MLLGNDKISSVSFRLKPPERIKSQRYTVLFCSFIDSLNVPIVKYPVEIRHSTVLYSGHVPCGDPPLYSSVQRPRALWRSATLQHCTEATCPVEIRHFTVLYRGHMPCGDPPLYSTVQRPRARWRSATSQYCTEATCPVEIRHSMVLYRCHVLCGDLPLYSIV